MDAATHIHVKGAREHNLQNLELRIPRGRLVVMMESSFSSRNAMVWPFRGMWLQDSIMPPGMAHDIDDTV